MATVYYCWECGKESPPGTPTDTHYELGYEVHFCGPAHFADYQVLKGM